MDLRQCLLHLREDRTFRNGTQIDGYKHKNILFREITQLTDRA